MSLRSLSSYCLAIACILLSVSLQGQSQCFIRTDQSFQLQSQPRTTVVTETKPYYDRIPWHELGHTNLIDEKCTKLELPSGQKSEALWIHDFGFNLPDNALVTGIEVKLSGSTLGSGELKDNRIFLTDSSGKTTGKNKGNKAIKGSPWNQQSSIYDYWTYGSSKDNWEVDWTPEEINSEKFGISIELINRSSEIVTGLLDQIVMTVYYEAAIDFCDDLQYISVFADQRDDVVAYDWSVPSELKTYPQPGLPNLMTIGAKGSEFGEYEICLTRTFEDSTQDQCCNAFNLRSCEKAGIGDFIWHDLNGNGLQDSNEPGIDNKRVFLYNESMVELAETVTSGGYYQFDNINPGSYFIRVDVTGMQITQSSDKSEDMNSDFYEYLGSKMSRLITVGPGEYVSNVDFGFTDKNLIEGLCWLDKNANGDYDAEDEMLDNVRIDLLTKDGAFVRAVYSDQNGEYRITGIEDGEYKLKMYKSTEYIASDEGEENDINEDYFTEEFEVEVNSRLNYNAAFFRYASLYGRVWLDRDFDGSQTTEEEDLEGIVVKLYDCNNNYLSETLTDENGVYLFENLRPGDYMLCVSTDRTDIYIAKAIECSSCIALLENQTVDVEDFVFNIESSSLELNIFKDKDDSMDNNAEDGLEGWTVSLYNCDAELINTLWTNAEGTVAFDGLQEGEYYYTVEFEDGHFVTESLSANLEQDIYTSDCIEVSDDIQIALPVLKWASIGDWVWYDKNGNGIQDNAEMGLESIEIELYDENEILIAEASSDENGEYLFSELPAGNYFLAIRDLETLFLPTDEVSNDHDNDSDFFLQSDQLRTERIELFYFDERNDIDFGVVAADQNTSGDYEISGNIFQDNNGDLEQLDEPGIDSVLVSLYTCNGTLVDQQYTSGDGDYSFQDLASGDYYIEWSDSNGFAYDLAIDSDISEMTSENGTDCFTLDEEDLTISLAFLPFSRLGDRVWLDENVNGQQDAGEPGVENMDIIILDDEDNVLESTTTDSEGFYSFENLRPGTYRVELTNAIEEYTPTLQAVGDDQLDSDLRIEQSRYVSEYIVLEDGTEILDLDLGLNFHHSIIGGTVFLDESKDGTRSGVEQGIADVTVELLNDEGVVVQTTETSTAGIYSFYNVGIGTHQLRFVAPEIYIFTAPNIGGDELFDSDVEYSDGRTHFIETVSTQVIEGVNAGLVATSACVSGYYWIDLNEDGLLETDAAGTNNTTDEEANSGLTEPPVVSAEVILYDGQGQFVDATTTDGNGQYLFCDITPGDYYMNFAVQTGYLFTIENQGADERLDSDVINTEGDTEVFTLKEGDMFYGLNAGIREDLLSITVIEDNAQDIEQDISMRSSDQLLYTEVYPNPSFGQDLNIRINGLERSTELNYRIYDTSGRQVHGENNLWLSPSDNIIKPFGKTSIEQGIYTVQIQIENKTENHRVVIFSF